MVGRRVGKTLLSSIISGNTRRGAGLSLQRKSAPAAHVPVRYVPDSVRNTIQKVVANVLSTYGTWHDFEPFK